MQLEQPPVKNSNADTEFSLYEGILQICRVVGNEPLNQHFIGGAASGQPFETILPANTVLSGKLVGHDVVFSAEKEEAVGEGECGFRSSMPASKAA